MAKDARDEDEVEESDDFQCVICHETFEDQQALERHGEEEHEGDQDHSKQP